MSQVGGQGPQGTGGAGQPVTAAGAQRPGAQITLYRPEQIRNLQILTEDEKSKFENALAQLWKGYETATQGTPEQNDAKTKIVDFCKMLHKKLQDRRAQYAKQLQIKQQQQAAQAAQAGGGQTQMNDAQPAQGGAAKPAAGAQATAGAGAASGATAAAAAPTAQQGGKIPDHILSHVNQMTYIPPPQLADKSPEGVRKWQGDMRARYAKGLLQMDQMRTQIGRMEAQIKERNEKGNPLTAEEQKNFSERKTAYTRAHQDAAKFVDTFRKQQEGLRGQRAQVNGGAAAAAAAAAANQNLKPQPGQSSAAAGAASSPTTGLQTSSNATAAVNAGVEAAKNQQLAAGRLPGANVKGVPGVGQQLGAQQVAGQHQSQPPPATHLAAHLASTGQAAAAQIGQHSAQTQQPQQGQIHQPGMKTEPGVQGPPHPAPINTALAASGLPAAGTPTQASARIHTPQTAAAQNGPPRPLSQREAMTIANSRTSQPNSAAGAGGTPSSAAVGVMGVTSAQLHGHPGQTPPGQTIQSKMPIPKTLPEKSMQQPQPVALGGGIGSGRPTYSGGGGLGGGVMGQPVISRTPAFQLEGEGERVLNKKKLDELVRQICGGTVEGQETALLAPEVEESVLNLADSFVDTVLHHACRNAKERGSKVLEIRDIQLVLERTYNIRIPGYSSDELRTVRKAQPSPAWINKMSAVQAAKVMPGKGDP